jgi:hypothetical protein
MSPRRGSTAAQAQAQATKGAPPHELQPTKDYMRGYVIGRIEGNCNMCLWAWRSESRWFMFVNEWAAKHLKKYWGGRYVEEGSKNGSLLTGWKLSKEEQLALFEDLMPYVLNRKKRTEMGLEVQKMQGLHDK